MQSSRPKALERVDDIFEGRVGVCLYSCDIELIDDIVADIEQALARA